MNNSPNILRSLLALKDKPCAAYTANAEASKWGVATSTHYAAFEYDTRYMYEHVHGEKAAFCGTKLDSWDRKWCGP